VRLRCQRARVCRRSAATALAGGRGVDDRPSGGPSREPLRSSCQRARRRRLRAGVLDQRPRVNGPNLDGGRLGCMRRRDVSGRGRHGLGDGCRLRGGRGSRLHRRCRLGRDGCGRRGSAGRSSFRRGNGGGLCRSSCFRGRLRLRRGTSGRPRRQQTQRIDVALVLEGDAHAEIHERLGDIDHAAWTDRPDDSTLLDERALLDTDRAEMDERSGVAERRLDRDRLPACRHRARERDDALRRRQHVCPRRRPEVDAAVLPGGVGMRAVE
jgi:hypothetical protein